MGKNLIFTLLARFYMVLCVATSLSSSNDESALLAFKSQINDPNKILSWSQEISFCSWIGITCGHRHQRVTGINVSNMSLEGTIAKEIGKLTFLKSLDISNNSFHDFIPDEIGNISRLREIKMQYNELNGQIPSSFGFLKNLQKLSLWKLFHWRNPKLGVQPLFFGRNSVRNQQPIWKSSDGYLQ